MVFIVLGAVKAAKAAKLEYQKDKRRNAIITPVEGSADHHADRPSTSHLGATEWWGTSRPSEPRDSIPHPASSTLHANGDGVGAWSRDGILQQHASPPCSSPPSQSSIPAAQTPSHSASSSSSAPTPAPTPALPDLVAYAPPAKPMPTQRSATPPAVQGSFEEVLRTRRSAPPPSGKRVQTVQDGSYEAKLQMERGKEKRRNAPEDSNGRMQRPPRRQGGKVGSDVAEGSFEALLRNERPVVEEVAVVAPQAAVAGSFEEAMREQKRVVKPVGGSEGTSAYPRRSQTRVERKDRVAEASVQKGGI